MSRRVCGLHLFRLQLLGRGRGKAKKDAQSFLTRVCFFRAADELQRSKSLIDLWMGNWGVEEGEPQLNPPKVCPCASGFGGVEPVDL